MTAEPDGRREAEMVAAKIRRDMGASEEYLYLRDCAAAMIRDCDDEHDTYDAIERAILARLALQETEGK